MYVVQCHLLFVPTVFNFRCHGPDSSRSTLQKFSDFVDTFTSFSIEKEKKKKPVSFIRHSVITKIQQPDVNSRGDEDKIIFSLHIVLDFVETVDVIASNRLTLHSLTLHGSGLYMLRISLKESDTLCGY